MSQRAFYEIEKPVRLLYIVAVQPDESTVKNEASCMYPGCEDEDGYGNIRCDEVYECDVCGGWFCFEHLNFKSDACETCTALPPAIQTEIKAFREKLNALR